MAPATRPQVAVMELAPTSTKPETVGAVNGRIVVFVEPRTSYAVGMPLWLTARTRKK